MFSPYATTEATSAAARNTDRIDNLTFLSTIQCMQFNITELSNLLLKKSTLFKLPKDVLKKNYVESREH